MSLLVAASSRSGLPAGDVLGRSGATSMRVVAEALSWQGVPYRFGGHTRQGVDCSGFVHEVMAEAEVGGEVPRSSSGFASWGLEVDGEIEPGDVVVFGSGKRANHVGIALSSEAFIHAASEGGKTGVVISGLADGAWQARLLAVRRPAREDN